MSILKPGYVFWDGLKYVTNQIVSLANTMGGDIAGLSSAATVVALQGRSVSSTAPSDGFTLVWVASTSSWEPMNIGGSPSGAAGGDLSSTYPNPLVSGLQGRSVSNAAPSDGYVLTWVSASSKWEPAAASGGGTAGGDLTGTYPNPLVASLTGSSSIVTVHANTINWDENAIPTISQTTRSTDASTNDLTISAQSAFTGFPPPTNKNGANILIVPGTSASGGLTSNVYIKAGSATEGNVSGGLIVQKSAVTNIKMAVAFTSTGAIWLGNDSANAPTTTNATVMSDISGATLSHSPSTGTASVGLVGKSAFLLTATNDGTHALVKTQGQSQGQQYSTSISYTVDDTVTSGNLGDEEVWMSGAGPVSLTLPNPAGWAGRRLRIVVNYNPAAAGGSIKRHATELINGAAADITLTGSSAFQVFWASTDGTNWIISRPSGTGVAGY